MRVVKKETTETAKKETASVAAEDKTVKSKVKPIAKAPEEKEAEKPLKEASVAKPAAESSAVKETEKKAEAPVPEEKAGKKAPVKKPTAEKKAPAKAASAKKAEAEKKAPAKNPAAEKKAPAKKAEAEKVAPAKEAPAKEAPAAEPKKRSVASTISLAKKVNYVLQYSGNPEGISYNQLVTNAKNVWRYDLGGKVSDIKTLELYVKPEEGKVYYVVNGDTSGAFDL